ncbi:hypothetical protein ZIOFF_000725 [Zingiber officinale]|uniref:Protein kinase domain-containing protein n=1 Tax=Zingiber officinale TaxID=94328 RepID=A0A8J5HUF1_ZINOF|nr:hypothetical protein ZIOFF_000725 [Zingiber officinale]
MLALESDCRRERRHGSYGASRVLRHDNFAKVYAVHDLLTGESVVMKVVGKENVLRAGMEEQVQREIAVMRVARRSNIVELHEDACGRTLHAATSAISSPPSTFAIAAGSFTVTLSFENLLLDDVGHLKIAELELSAFARADDLHLHTACGTPSYVVPEVIGNREYDGSMAGLCSCGVFLFLLLAGYHPFQDDNLVTMYRKTHRRGFHSPP